MVAYRSLLSLSKVERVNMSRVIRAGSRNPSGWRTNLMARLGLLVTGMWLTIAPFALEYRGEHGSVAATVNDSVVGAVVVGLALFTLLVPGQRPGGRR